MIKIIIFSVVFLIPFLLAFRFKDKRIGFFYVFFFLSGSLFFLALASQFLGIFGYWLISFFIVGGIIVLTKTDFKKILKNIRIKKINWVFVFVLFIIFIQMFSVHYNYTGTITSINGYEKVSNMKNGYPYLSDEWVSVPLMKYSIETGKIALINPLWKNTPFSNPNISFYVFSSAIALFAGIDPLFNFGFFQIASGMLICILIYFILRVNNLNPLSSALTTMFVPFILNGANLVGIWYYIPVTLGVIFFLLSFIFISTNNAKMFLLSGFFSFVFYPPIIVFLFITLIYYSIQKKIFAHLAIFLFWAVGILLLLASKTKKVSSLIERHLLYKTSEVGIPNFFIFNVVPLSALVLAVVGLFICFKKPKEKLWLIVSIFTGLLFWGIYSQSVFRFLIEYSKIVFITSLLIVIISGFGMDYLFEILSKNNFVKKCNLLEIGIIVLLFFCFIFAFSYTDREDWRKTELHLPDKKVPPAPPANRYLAEDDLELFSKIHNEIFLSYPWKGLVIGATTNNYPAVSKGSVITNNIIDYQSFLKESCERKIFLAKERNIKYIYFKKIECPEFELIGVSKEGLSLYKIP